MALEKYDLGGCRYEDIQDEMERLPPTVSVDEGVVILEEFLQLKGVTVSEAALSEPVAERLVAELMHEDFVPADEAVLREALAVLCSRKMEELQGVEFESVE